jgi:hypothetical protein
MGRKRERKNLSETVVAALTSEKESTVGLCIPFCFSSKKLGKKLQKRTSAGELLLNCAGVEAVDGFPPEFPPVFTFESKPRLLNLFEINAFLPHVSQ